MKTGLFSVGLVLRLEPIPHNISYTGARKGLDCTHTHTHLRLVVGLNRFMRNASSCD